MSESYYDEALRRGQWKEWFSVDFVTGVESSASHLIIPVTPAEFFASSAAAGEVLPDDDWTA